MHDNHANAAALAVFVCARPPNPEEMKLAPPIIIPINPTSWALVNVHAMTHADPFAAGETDSPADGLILHPVS